MKYFIKKDALYTKTSPKGQKHRKYVYKLSTCTGKRTGISIGLFYNSFVKLK